MRKFPNLIINQIWSHDLRGDVVDRKEEKMQLAKFARGLGHIPVFYLDEPGRIVVGCINPNGQVRQEHG